MAILNEIIAIYNKLHLPSSTSRLIIDIRQLNKIHVAIILLSDINKSSTPSSSVRASVTLLLLSVWNEKNAASVASNGTAFIPSFVKIGQITKASLSRNFATWALAWERPWWCRVTHDQMSPLSVLRRPVWRERGSACCRKLQDFM